MSSTPFVHGWKGGDCVLSVPRWKSLQGPRLGSEAMLGLVMQLATASDDSFSQVLAMPTVESRGPEKSSQVNCI